jgi:hypothetical protein
MRLKCPVCYKGTESLKRYGVIHYVLFLGIAVRWQHGSLTACPRCVRRRVLKDTLSPLHILSANLMWLLAVLPYNLGLMIASTIPGHSRAVLGIIERKLRGTVEGKGKETPEDEKIEWKLWHEDLFDRECPPNVETSGHGLVEGLTELWRRYLSASIGAGGERGLSRFHLSWEGGSATVSGDRKGAARLRGWVGDEPALLEKTALAHAELLLAGRTSEEILAAAAASADRGEFGARLSGLAG